jgi:hypothetical protein
MEQQTFGYFVSLFFLSLFFLFSLFLFSCELFLPLAPLSYMAARCKALRKPTEQPDEQSYASLVGRFLHNIYQKAVSMASKIMRKVRYVDLI